MRLHRFQRICVLFVNVRERHILKPRRMKCARDDRSTTEFLFCLRDAAAHIRLPQRIMGMQRTAFPQAFAVFRGSRAEIREVGASLEAILPEGVGICAGNALQPRIDRFPCRRILRIIFIGFPRKQAIRREIAEAHRNAVFRRPQNRLKLGRKFRKRIQHRPDGRSIGVSEDRGGELHIRRTERRNHPAEIGRPFNQHGTGRGTVEKFTHEKRAGRRKMPHAEIRSHYGFNSRQAA